MFGKLRAINAAILDRRYPGDCGQCATVDYAALRSGATLRSAIKALATRAYGKIAYALPFNRSGGYCANCVAVDLYITITRQR